MIHPAKAILQGVPSGSISSGCITKHEVFKFIQQHRLQESGVVSHMQVWKYKTSLNVFKHYKLKPSFSIIKDNKAKDKVGVGVVDKPPPPSFNNLNKFDPI